MAHKFNPTLARCSRLALAAVAITGLSMASSAGIAEAKVSPPEQLNTGHTHSEWPEGQVHPNDDPCSVGGPGADASVGCDDDSGIDDSDVGGGGWGGPGERIAVGRDRDDEAAKAEAEAEADDICHGSWDLRDFDFDFALGEPTVYTLTYECS